MIIPTKDSASSKTLTLNFVFQLEVVGVFLVVSMRVISLCVKINNTRFWSG